MKQQKGWLHANIERNVENKLHITWEDGVGEVSIYWSTSSEQIEENGEFLLQVSGGSSCTIEDPSLKARPYFRLVASNGQAATVAERRLPLQGAYNFRDLGGYETSDGRKVKWGKLYRSEELAGLTEWDIAYLQQSGLKLICDYRTDFEVTHKPNPSIAGARQVCLPVMQDIAKDLNINEFFQVGDLSMLGKPGEYLVKMNQGFVEGNEAFVRFLQFAQDPKSLPLVNHCTAGKDRTGFGSALVLLLLGVPEETVMQDYLLSNGFREKLNQKMMAFLGAKLQNEESKEILGAMFEARAEYLQAAIDEIKRAFGNVENYAETGLGFTKDQLENMKALLLEEKE
ncbi:MULTISPECIES: tyrosine-protein phosphatase [Bacillus cereus group]|uniref:Protein-tyrosine-phosphatase n=1 Tax=Bacillus cereus TaxID=1396 RepID=A0AA44Q717_BACCE|nr:MULTISPECIES: tyrosine-protein phosphatase [Bacillus cereus group]EEL49991.1 Protein tyrosine/serine phosphatase [Bacillus cereus Rock3-44]PFA14197.1 protein-tyrosine-phosphatase [Bacillus cereus]PFN02682.1 protein-tyrosine-phosphatase [Bacillus cereus]PFR20547.1 protein-tyrosine-phosphatase [Bacillus cereus]PFR93387.1 protein-tyrosine-phosphatase [Bacillus cereus]